MSRLRQVHTIQASPRMLVALSLLPSILTVTGTQAAQNTAATSLSSVQPAKNCARNYKKALSYSHKRYAQRLKYAVKISHQKVNSFPGHWMIAPALKLGDKGKKLSKKQRRRSKRGIQLVALQNPHFSTQHYTGQEQQILHIADSVIRWRGKDPAFNKRGRYGWLTTRIAADLRVYMGQPDHPALCTGANLMMNHLYNNSGRFRKRVSLIKKLSPLAHQYAAARYRTFKYIMETGKAPLYVKLGSLEKYASLNGLMTKTAKLLSGRKLMMQISQEEGFLPTVKILKKFAALDDGLTIRSGKTVLTRMSLPVRRPRGIALTKRKDKTKVKIKTVFVHKETLAVVGNFSLDKPQLSPFAQEALRKTLSAIEAAYYIDHIYQSYEALNASIYGAISAVRQSHATHCRCAE